MSELKYFSQYKQDWFLDSKVFKQKENGTFVDIGANDGITISNTYFFEKFRNWKGICVEPIPNTFSKLEKNRSCITVNGCIASSAGFREFLAVEGYSEMLSGLVEKYDEKHLKRIEAEIAEYGGSKKQIQVKCFQLNDLLSQQQIQDVDYCSIDTEGGELDILESIDFNGINIKVFTVENNYGNDNIKSFLKSKKYKQIHKIKCDEFYEYKRKNFWFF